MGTLNSKGVSDVVVPSVKCRCIICGSFNFWANSISLGRSRCKACKSLLTQEGIYTEPDRLRWLKKNYQHLANIAFIILTVWIIWGKYQVRIGALGYGTLFCMIYWYGVLEGEN